MRNGWDRLRHAILFEIFGLCLITPVISLIFHKGIMQTSVLGAGMAVWAMVWNLIYNYLFDRALLKLSRPLDRRPAWMRIIHAVLFEFGFVFFSVPVIMWWLSLNLWQAISMDISMTLFYMVYALVYNWAYDRIFPYPESKVKQCRQIIPNGDPNISKPAMVSK